MAWPGREIRDAALRPVFGALNALVVPAAKAGVASPCAIGSGIVVLETTGRKTGKAREVPLLGARLGDRVLVSTVRGGSQWAKNLDVTPEAAVWVDGTRRRATGSVTFGPLTVASLTLDGHESADAA